MKAEERTYKETHNTMVQYFLSVKPTLISLIVVGFFLPLIVASSQSTNANKVIDITVICLRILSLEQFCEDLLNSLPAGPGADVFTLVEQTIDVLQSNITNMTNLIHKLIPENPKDDRFLIDCQGYYGGEPFGPVFDSALYFVQQIRQALKSKDYFAVDYFVVAVIQRNYDCVLKEKPPGHLPSLQDNGDYIYRVGNVLQTVLYYLERN